MDGLESSCRVGPTPFWGLAVLCSGFSGNCDLLQTSTICNTSFGQGLLKGLSCKTIFQNLNALDHAAL